MAATQLQSSDIGSIQRNDVDTTTSGQAIITKIIVAGAGAPTMTQTGVDAGTGDVTLTFSSASIGGSGITRSISVISTATTGAAASNTDYVYFCNGTFPLTLPSALGNTNIYTVKNIGNGIITIATTSLQTIDGGAAPITITRTNNSLDIISDGQNWKLI